jgi:formyl-CoA transferase
LGLLGAEIIKIEAPEHGDLARKLGADASLNERLMGASFLAQNSGKKSVTGQPQVGGRKGRPASTRQEGARVGRNFRPGVMDRLGLGYDQLRPAQSVARLLRDLGLRSGTVPMREAPAYDQIISGPVRRDEHHGG